MCHKRYKIINHQSTRSLLGNVSPILPLCLSLSVSPSLFSSSAMFELPSLTLQNIMTDLSKQHTLFMIVSVVPKNIIVKYSIKRPIKSKECVHIVPAQYTQVKESSKLSCLLSDIPFQSSPGCHGHQDVGWIILESRPGWELAVTFLPSPSVYLAPIELHDY